MWFTHRLNGTLRDVLITSILITSILRHKGCTSEDLTLFRHITNLITDKKIIITDSHFRKKAAENQEYSEGPFCLCTIKGSLEQPHGMNLNQ